MKNLHSSSYRVIVDTLFDRYECIYDIDVETSNYKCFYQSLTYSKLEIEGQGNDFFKVAKRFIKKTIHDDDKEYVSKMLNRDKILKETIKNKEFTFSYRLMIDNKPIYHRIRTNIKYIDKRKHIILTVRDIQDEISKSKDIYIQTFGRFVVLRNGKPLPLRGKAKEILALVLTKKGKEISNEEIYSTIWEDRPYSNTNMSVYYNALGRLRRFLIKENLENILISTSRGQMINNNVFDCDYYNWINNKEDNDNKYEGEFMSEYSWSEYLLNEFEERE